MTVSVKIIFTREDADTPWFHEVDNDDRTAWQAYKMENYVNTNKFKSFFMMLNINFIKFFHFFFTSFTSKIPKI